MSRQNRQTRPSATLALDPAAYRNRDVEAMTAREVAEAAARCGISPRRYRYAMRIQRDGLAPLVRDGRLTQYQYRQVAAADLVAEVRSGALTVAEAVRRAKADRPTAADREAALRRKVANLEAEVANLGAEVAELEAEVDERDEQILALMLRVDELEGREAARLGDPDRDPDRDRRPDPEAAYVH